MTMLLPTRSYIKIAVAILILVPFFLFFMKVSEKAYIKRSIEQHKLQLQSNISRLNLYKPINQQAVTVKPIIIDRDGLIHPEYANATPHFIPQMPGYAIVNKSLCTDPRLRYLIYTYSAADHFEGRDSVRKTYGNTDLYKDKRLGRVFFLAKTKNVELQQKIEEESKKYGDIIQANYIDTYANLTLKGIFTIKFFKDYCRKDIIAIKTDDDLFYDIFHIIDKLKSYKLDHRFVACPVQQEDTMPILRDPKTCSKWCVRNDELQGRNAYPRYCSGWVWIFPLNFVDDMLKAIARTRFFRVEDFFISGFIMGQVPNLDYIDVLDETTIYSDPPGSGMVKMIQAFSNIAQPRKLILSDVPDAKSFFTLWNHCINSLQTKFPATLKELNQEELKKSIRKLDTNLH